MKAETKIIGTFCDWCNALVGEYSGYSCHTCGKDACYDCAKKQTVEYSHGVYCSGSGDGRYCKECDKKHLQSGRDAVWNAFQRVKRAREMVQARNDEMHAEVKTAETLLEIAQEKAKKKGTP